jgi:hypothetical protein
MTDSLRSTAVAASFAIETSMSASAVEIHDLGKAVEHRPRQNLNIGLLSSADSFPQSRDDCIGKLYFIAGLLFEFRGKRRVFLRCAAAHHGVRLRSVSAHSCGLR